MAQTATNPKIEELRFRLKSDPKSRLFYQLAEELRRGGQFAESEQILRSGLEVYPTYLAAWVSLGRVLREQKNETGAVDALTRALQLDPGNVVAARLLADAYRNLGNVVEAVKKYKLVHALMPGDEELKGTISALEQQLNQAAAPPKPAPEESRPADAGWQAAPSAPAEDARPTEEESNAATVEEPLLANAGETEPAFELPGVAAFEEPPATGRAEEIVADDSSAQTAELFDSQAAEPFAAAQDAEASAGGDLFPEESPFDRTSPPFQEGPGTGDAEPMLAAHEESPFEEPVEGATAAAFSIEAPAGMHIDEAPVTAEVPGPVLDEESDVFAPAAAEAAPSEDLTNTLTMADLYAGQGLVNEARHIYENILSRDPGNAEVRAKLNAITPRVNPKIDRLERWLSKVSRREVGSV
jgi:tetratricopeptide (TPR) repeat protein